MPRLKRLWLPLLDAAVVGTLSASVIVSAIGVGWALALPAVAGLLLRCACDHMARGIGAISFDRAPCG